MKILILQSELGVLRGGGENFTRNLFTAFVARGHEVAAAFVADPFGHYPLPLPLGITPIPLAGVWSMNFGQSLLSLWGRYLPSRGWMRARWDHLQAAVSWRTIRWHYRRFQERIEKRFAQHWDSFDAIYVHSDVTLASKVAGYRPTVLRLPGPVSEERQPALRKVHAVCANGDALARIRTFMGTTALELPIGLDTDLFTAKGPSIRSALGWTDQHRVIGYVGRFIHLKGVILLAAAFRDIARRVPDARLLLVGHGEDEKSLRALLTAELTHGLVHIESGVDHTQLPSWYRAMDLFVMPSRYENFSNAVLEAMACGVPVLASQVGGNNLLKESDAGWLFPPESPTSLSEVLYIALLADTERKSRGQTGLDFVQERYSWDRSAACLEQILVQRLGIPT